MNNTEFDVIKKYFTFSDSREDVFIAGGDDCASVTVPDNKQLLVTTDTLISGVHFPVDTRPQDIAYKAIMVNLSDLAAMGATPAWITLAISLPEIDSDWLDKFSRSLSEVLSHFDVSLIGGDTTRGALSTATAQRGRFSLIRRSSSPAMRKFPGSPVNGETSLICWARRITVRTRATSSSTANGFVM